MLSLGTCSLALVLCPHTELPQGFALFHVPKSGSTYVSNTLLGRRLGCRLWGDLVTPQDPRLPVSVAARLVGNVRLRSDPMHATPATLPGLAEVGHLRLAVAGRGAALRQNPGLERDAVDHVIFGRPGAGRRGGAYFCAQRMPVRIPDPICEAGHGHSRAG